MRKNDSGFTGLEAAIIMIAFVIVASVFAYEILGSGFFVSQKSQEVVNTGVGQTSRSILLAGDVMGIGSPEGGKLAQIKLTIGLTAGNSPVEINKTSVSFRIPTAFNGNIFDGANWTDANCNPDGHVKWVSTAGTANALLEKDEMVMLTIYLAPNERPGPDTKIYLEIKPPSGAVLPVLAKTPSYIGANEYMQIG